MNRYRQHMTSDAWREKREQVMQRAGGRCERCKKRRAKQVHHLTYARLGDEDLADLQAVCVRCHRDYHPDKIELSPGAIFTVEWDCVVCPSAVATVFMSTREAKVLCQCGHSETMRVREWRHRVERAERERDPRSRGCPDCGFLAADDYGLTQHRQAKHGAARTISEMEPTATSRPTLEELEYERREAERARVRRLMRKEP